MLRRPQRTALYSALSALAGGLRGFDAQQERERLREEREGDRERQDLYAALQLADRGAVARPPRLETDFAVPMPDAVLPELGFPTTFRGTEYIVPNRAERARQEEEQARARREAERGEANARAFGAFRLVNPNHEAEYDPNIDYTLALREQPNAATTTAATVRSDELMRERAQRRMTAQAWFNRTFADPSVPQGEKNRIGAMYGELARTMPPNTDPADIFVALMEGEEARIRNTALAALEGQRDASAAAALERAGLGGAGGGVAAPGGATLPPPPGLPPATPVVPPVTPVVPPVTPPAAAPVQTAPGAPPIIPPQPAWFNPEDIGMTWEEFYRANQTGGRP